MTSYLLPMNAPTEPHGPTFNMTHESTEPIEHVTWNGQFIATILRQDFRPDKTTFITPDRGWIAMSERRFISTGLPKPKSPDATAAPVAVTPARRFL